MASVSPGNRCDMRNAMSSIRDRTQIAVAALAVDQSEIVFLSIQVVDSLSFFKCPFAPPIGKKSFSNATIA